MNLDEILRKFALNYVENKGQDPKDELLNQAKKRNPKANVGGR